MCSQKYLVQGLRDTEKSAQAHNCLCYLNTAAIAKLCYLAIHLSNSQATLLIDQPIQSVSLAAERRRFADKLAACL